MKTNRAVPPGDIPPNLIKLFAKELAIPLCHIINSSIRDGVWGKIYKSESVTPIPKVYPPQTVDDLRNISGLGKGSKIKLIIFAEFSAKGVPLPPSPLRGKKLIFFFQKNFIGLK